MFYGSERVVRWVAWGALILVASVIMPGSGFFETATEVVYLPRSVAPESGAANGHKKPCGCKEAKEQAPE